MSDEIGYKIKKSTLIDISEALRAKSETEDLITPESIPSIIENLKLPLDIDAIKGIVEGNVNSVTIPDGITKIKRGLFENDRDLVRVNLPEGIQLIGSSAFEYCSSLTTINFPKSLEEIGGYAFQNCTKLQLTKLPNTIQKIEGYAFSGCQNISLANLPPNITSLGNYIFRDCHNITLTKLPEGVSWIGYDAFKNCYNIKITELPAALGTIYQNAFQNCTGITSLKFNSIVYANGSIFSGATNLTNIEIPENYNESLNLNGADSLTTECLQNIINNLADLTNTSAKTFTIGATNLAKLKDEDLAKLENKNWNYL